MVLIVEENQYNCFTQSLVDVLVSNAHLREVSTDFVNVEKCHIKDSDDLVYVHQGEMAIVPHPTTMMNKTNPVYLGSADATSCYIVILQSPEGCAIVHLDSETRVCSFFRQVEDYFTECSKIKTYLVGGFPDHLNLWLSVLSCILKCLVVSKKSFHLDLFCIGYENTVCKTDSLIKYPAVMGILYDCLSDTIKPSIFDWKARGPLAPLRLSRLHSNNQEAINVYDCQSRCLVISSFSYAVRCRFPDITEKEILENSTTPDQEPYTFIEGMTATHKLMYNFPDPQHTWFQNGPLVFKCIQSPNSSSSWHPSNESVSAVINHPLMNLTAGANTKY